MFADKGIQSDRTAVHSPAEWRAGGFIGSGILAVVMLFGGLAAWAMTADLDGAVVASAELRVESRPKPIAHLEGGVVRRILVREGEAVRAGQVLLRLDETNHRANLSILSGQIDALRARQARLTAERDGDDAITFPADLQRRTESDPLLREMLKDQRRLFEARREGATQTKSQLEERISQFREQIAGTEALVRSAEKRLRSAKSDVERQRTLLEQGHSTAIRVNELERLTAQIEGEVGSQRAEIARLRGQIEETRLQITIGTETRREQALVELGDLEARLAERQEQKLVAAEALRNVELIAPQDGVIQHLAVHAVGAVLQPRTPALTIVPVADHLVLEARVPTVHRDSIHVGQAARVRFPSFNQRTSPEINASVSHISADRVAVEQTGETFYAVVLGLSARERARLGSDRRKLVPGLPAEVYINTGARTAFGYFIKPLADNWSRAFKEE